MSRDLRTDSERAREALEWRDKFHGRPDADHAKDDDYGGDGCLGVIIMFVVATFSIGALFCC